MARIGGGSNAARRAEQSAPDWVQRGYLLLPQVLMHSRQGRHEAASEFADAAIAIGEKAGGLDLIALAGSLSGLLKNSAGGAV